jgi:predicted RNase H-like HicB family nuclease
LKLGVQTQEPKDDIMKETYTAVVKQSGPWWIGWIEEIPGVNCQERSKEALLETLKVTLQEALEFNRREAIEAAGEGFEEAPIAV